MAQHAARGFARQGAGMRALSLWIAASGDGELPPVSAVGGERLRPELLPAAIALLAACDPPNNHALYNFIAQNADALDAARRRDVVRLVTWPTRTDTSRLGDVLGWVAIKAFPEVPEIQRLWTA